MKIEIDRKLHGFILLIIISILSSCQIEDNHLITQRSDYEKYLKDTVAIANKIENINSKINFWDNKLMKQPESHMFLIKKADLLSRRFKITGNINDIDQSNLLLDRAGKITHYSNVGILHRQAHNAITRHEFREARFHLKNALAIGENKLATLLMNFDLEMEMGGQQHAHQLLAKVKNKSAYDYLIRYSKYKDQQGQLDSAIFYMEQAFDRIKADQNIGLQTWTLSNLADLYGHAGKIEKSYANYLKVLNLDPGYHYALKGIAWIAYSNDNNVSEAMEILDFIDSQHKLPDILFLKAEIAEFAGDSLSSIDYLNQFYQQASSATYMGMYNRYIADIAMKNTKTLHFAMTLAMDEILERPGPQSYDLLAWIYYQMGDINEALKIVRDEVEGFTHEPEILYHLGAIYLESGNHNKAKQYLSEALESKFELGPVLTNEIKTLIES